MARAAALLALVLASSPVFAHPGHDPIAVTGTLVRVLPLSIDVETFDTTVFQKRTLSIVVDEYTRWRLGKKTVQPGEMPPGTPVTVVFTHVDQAGGSSGLIAMEIRGREVKKKR